MKINLQLKHLNLNYIYKINKKESQSNEGEVKEVINNTIEVVETKIYELEDEVEVEVAYNIKIINHGLVILAKYMVSPVINHQIVTIDVKDVAIRIGMLVSRREGND